MQGRKGTTDTLLLDKAFPNLAHADQISEESNMRDKDGARWKSPKLSTLRKNMDKQ